MKGKGFVKGNREDEFNFVKIEVSDSVVKYQEINNAGEKGRVFDPEDVVVLESDEFLVVSHHSVPVNVSHFQGTSRDRLGEFMDMVRDKSVLKLPKELTVLTTYTDPDMCILYQQLKSHGIECVNTYDHVDKSKLSEQWNMVDKIGMILAGLEHVDTELVLICDGYDVYINSFENIIPKFKKTNLRMLFNGTKNNFPLTHVDKIHDRDWRGDFRYFNAGCAIGYVEDFKQFYEICKNLATTVNNPWESEQYVLRVAFSGYSENVNTPLAYMDFDWECNLFQTYVNSVALKLFDNQEIYAIV